MLSNYKESNEPKIEEEEEEEKSQSSSGISYINTDQALKIDEVENPGSIY